MNFRVALSSMVVAWGLVACGGGGGSPGTSSGEVVVPPPPATPTMSLSLVDSAGTVLTSPNLSQTQSQFLKVGLKDAAGAAVPNTRVTVTLENAIAVLVPATGQLTDASGYSQFKIQPTNVTSSGVVLATARHFASARRL